MCKRSAPRFTPLCTDALSIRGLWTLGSIPSPEEYTALLRPAGFTVGYIELIPRPTELPGDILAWLEIFAQPFIRAVREAERASFLQEISDELETHLRDAQGHWIADYVRLRFLAKKLD